MIDHKALNKPVQFELIDEKREQRPVSIRRIDEKTLVVFVAITNVYRPANRTDVDTRV